LRRNFSIDNDHHLPMRTRMHACMHACIYTVAYDFFSLDWQVLPVLLPTVRVFLGD